MGHRDDLRNIEDVLDECEPDPAPVATPDTMASFKVIDAWLMDRGWVQDRGSWRLMNGRRVIIATHEEADKIQRRRDAQARRKR
jgi:hypothetical protein